MFLWIFCIAYGTVILADEPRIQMQDDGSHLTFLAGKRPMLVYNYAVISPPAGIDPLYRRSGHIHPLYSPGGKIITDDFSEDHAHQHGIFFAFVKAKFDGETLDFWNQHRKTANIKHEKIIATPAQSSLKTVQTHYRLKDNKTIFRETWTIKPFQYLECYVIDLNIDIRNVTGQPIKIEKNHYGAFGFRGAKQWRQPAKSNFKFQTATGKSRKNGNQSREPWVVMSGKVDNEYCGVAVIGQRSNYKFPQPVRLHPSMPYFSFAPMALDPFIIKPGETFNSRFRIVTFDGKPDTKKIDLLAKF
jgi:hypothetical protein